MTIFLWIYLGIAIVVAIIDFIATLSIKEVKTKTNKVSDYIVWFLLSCLYGIMWPGWVAFRISEWLHITKGN